MLEAGQQVRVHQMSHVSHNATITEVVNVEGEGQQYMLSVSLLLGPLTEDQIEPVEQS
jgi:hypothetical protein